MIRKVAQVVKKNFRVIVRSKTSALIIIFGPLFLMLLVGAAFNSSNIYDIKIGAYSDSYSSLTDEIIESLEGQQFKVQRFDSEESCINGVKQGVVHICGIFPANLEANSDEAGNIDFHVDQSRMNLIWIVIDAVSEKVSLKSSEISEELTGVLVSRLQNANTVLTSKKGAISKITTNAIDRGTKLSLLIDDLDAINLQDNITSLGALENASDNENLDDDTRDSLGEVYNQIAITRKQLQAAADAITSAKSEINSFKSEVDEDSENLKLIQSSVNDIVKSINSIDVINVQKIVSPITTSINPVVSDSTHLTNLFPTLLMFVVMFVSLLLASTLVIKEKLSIAYFRNFITPTSNLVFIFGTFFTNVIIVVLQLTILFAAISIFLQSQLFGVLLGTGLVLLIIASVFILMGMLVGYVFNSEETSTLAAIAIGSVLLIFSNTILPLESLPQTLKQIASYTPFSIGERVLKQVMVFDNSLFSVRLDIYALLGFIVLFFLMIVLVDKASSKSYLVSRYIRDFQKKRASSKSLKGK